LVHPDVIGRQRAVTEHGHARELAQQGAQRRGAAQGHPGAACGQQRQVACELDRVAEPLLGEHEDVAAVERLALPVRARQRRERVREAALAPLVARPALLEAAGEQAGDALVPMRGGEVGPQVDGALAGSDGLGGGAALAEDVAQADMRLHQHRVETDRLAQRGLGGLGAVQVGQGVAEVGVGRSVRRVGGHGERESLRRRPEPRQGVERGAMQEVRLGEHGRRLRDIGQQRRHGGRDVARAMPGEQGAAQRQHLTGMAGPQGIRAGQQRRSLRSTAGGQRQQPKQEQRGRAVRGEAEQGAVGGLCLGEATGALLRDRGEKRVDGVHGRSMAARG